MPPSYVRHFVNLLVQGLLELSAIKDFSSVPAFGVFHGLDKAVIWIVRIFFIRAGNFILWGLRTTGSYLVS
jgi:hypothetical protein